MSAPGQSPQAMEEWSQLYGELRRFIRRRVSDEHVAEDLLQDIALRIYESCETLSDDSRFFAWMYRIARNRIVDHYRQRRADAPGSGEAVEELAAPEEEEDTRDLERALGAWLVAVVDELPETYRDAVRMAEVEGISQREIGERLGLSTPGAKSRVQRGRRELEKRLRQCCAVELDRRGNVIEVRSKADCC